MLPNTWAGRPWKPLSTVLFPNMEIMGMSKAASALAITGSHFCSVCLFRGRFVARQKLLNGIFPAFVS